MVKCESKQIQERTWGDKKELSVRDSEKMAEKKGKMRIIEEIARRVCEEDSV